MFRCHRFHSLALQVVALMPGSHTGQVTCRTGVKSQRILQGFAFKRVRMRRQQVLKNAAFEWQEHIAKQMWV